MGLGAALLLGGASVRAQLREAVSIPEIEAPLASAGAAGTSATADGRVAVFVELDAAPAARLYGEMLTAGRSRGEAVRAAGSQRSSNDAAQEALLPSLRSPEIGARVIYRVQRALNAIAVHVRPDRLSAIRALPGVRAVTAIPLDFPTNSTSVPFLGVPAVWENTIGLPQGLTGQGVSIGIIDTGIDYQHANFGGNGLLAEYQANDRAVAPDAYFPTARVVGGTDFAGDAYTGVNVPAPDPDPMDCNGHGSHVAGSAGGGGVNSDGSPFTGAYDTAVPFGTLRIGPGVAPRADLYALRVFGCAGGTNLTVQAIDWAIDPNNDDDFSDHLDVINMSLGTNNGSATSSTAVASDNAALAGVIVVASAGNAGDTYFITGSPGVAGRALSTAAAADSGLGGTAVVVNSPPSIAGTYAASSANTFAPTPAPNPTGQTANIVVGLDPANAAGPLTTDGCSPLTNAAAVAGNIALIDRGTCGFQVKANNAQAAGAVAVIIANNITGDPNLIAMGPTGTVPVTIPAMFISQADRNTIVAGLPANATLPALTAADTIASFSSRGPRRATSPVRLKPDIAAPGSSITSTQTGVTCTAGGCQRPNASGYLPGNQALTISGTSMAAPHMAGLQALLRQLHPDWSVEELKALAMNGALHDVTIGANGSGLQYGPGRIGSGRADPQSSAKAAQLAFNAEESGLVSVSFGSQQPTSASFQVKRVRVLNKGLAAATFGVGLDTVVDASGISFSLPGGSSVTVPAGDAVELDVQVNFDPTLMDHDREATVAPIQAAPVPLAALGNVPRHWLTEEAAYLTFTPSGGSAPAMRVPLYVTSRPGSDMSAPPTIVTGGAGTGATTIPLSGTGVCTGTLAAGPTCNGTFPPDEVSVVTPFELQVVSPPDPVNAPPYADIQYAGVAFDPTTNLYLFGISTWGEWSSLTDVAFNIYVDFNEDGTYDRILFNSNPGTMGLAIFGNGGATGQDTFINAILNTANNQVAIGGNGAFVNRLSANFGDTAVLNNSVLFLSASPAQLGLTAGDTTFRYRVSTCPGFVPLCQQLNGLTPLDQAAGPFFWNSAAQGLNFGGTHLEFDLNGEALPVTWNTANMATNGSLGALLLHHHNGPGRRAEVVLLEGAQSADLSITKSVSPPNPTLGQNVTFTLTVTNAGPDAASGVVVSDTLPAGLTYVSDDGGGAYVPASGTWTVGALAVSASASLNIVATVDTTDAVVNTATIAASTPLDPNPNNNESSVTVMAPRSADLTLGMTVSSPTVLVADTVTYTLTVTNNGDDLAFALDVQEGFPAFPTLNPTTFTASQGSYNPATGLWNLASLASGAAATLDIDVIAPNVPGPLSNQGSATAGTADPDNANNFASATTTIVPRASVAGTKTVSGSFIQGTSVTYTIVLTNSTGNQPDNSGNEFVDTLPAQLTLVSAVATSGTAVATVATNTVTWNGSLASGGSVTITITATINLSATGTVSNQGTINFDQDGNGTNETMNLTDDPSVGGAIDPTDFGIIQLTATPTATSPPTATTTPTATATSTPTATGTPTVTATPGPLCSRSDSCFTFALMGVDFSVANAATFDYRLTNNCADPLSRVDFRFVPGAVVTSPGEGAPFTSSPSGRVYTTDVVAGGGHEGVGFVPQSNALPSGESDNFQFTVDRAGLSDGTVLWNNATAGTSTGRIDIRSTLCYTLPAPRLVEMEQACYSEEASGQWSIDVQWRAVERAASGGFRLWRVESGSGQAVVVGGVLMPDATGLVRYSDRVAAGSVAGYRIQALDRAGAPEGQAVDVALGTCGRVLGPRGGAWSQVALALAVLAGLQLLLRRLRSRRSPV